MIKGFSGGSMRLAGTIFMILAIWIPSVLGQAASGPVVEEVRFKKGSDTIAGILILPPGKGPFPAVAFLHGSEAGSRSMPHYRRAADRLVNEGIAVLITDKRGVGDSTGKYVETPEMSVPAEDTVAKVDYLSGRAEIDPKRIGVMGWSQGGWVGPLAATMSPKIAFVIAVSGPSVSIRDQVIYQRGQELLDAGYSQKDVDEIAVFRRQLWTYYATGEGFDKVKGLFESEKGRTWFAKITSGPSDKLYEPSALKSEDFQFFRNLQYDPAPVLAQLKAPLLALFGEKDRLIPVVESVSTFWSILGKSGHKDFTIRVFPNAGHGIQIVGGAQGKPPEPAPGYWQTVIDWIKTRTNRAANTR